MQIERYVPVLVPRLVQVVERNPPVVITAQSVTVSLCGKRAGGGGCNAHSVRVGEDGPHRAPSQTSAQQHVAELSEAHHGERDEKNRQREDA